MTNNKKPGGPLDTEGRAMDGVPTIELLTEFQRREDGVMFIMGSGKTFTNPLDEPIRVFAVPEMSCKAIKPRLSRRIIRHMETHRPPLWILPLINALSFLILFFIVVVTLKK